MIRTVRRAVRSKEAAGRRDGGVAGTIDMDNGVFVLGWMAVDAIDVELAECIGWTAPSVSPYRLFNLNDILDRRSGRAVVSGRVRLVLLVLGLFVESFWMPSTMKAARTTARRDIFVC